MISCASQRAVWMITSWSWSKYSSGFDAQGWSKCATKTEYLCYVLTRDSIKPQPKKVQAILVLTPSQNVRQLHRFLGMVQYYRDLWTKSSEMLSPLTNLVGECGHTKAMKADKTKWKLWHWKVCIRLHLATWRKHLQRCCPVLSWLLTGVWGAYWQF
jgi:hypothetical protein